MQMRSPTDYSWRFVRGCVLAYLDGSPTPAWVLGCVRKSGASPEVILRVMQGTKEYGDVTRWAALAQALGVG